MQNGFIESFNGRLRDELLNETHLSSLTQARATLLRWQLDYNTTRSRSKLGWQTTIDFAATFHRGGIRRYASQMAPRLPRPLNAPERANPTAGTNSRLDKNSGQRQSARPPVNLTLIVGSDDHCVDRPSRFAPSQEASAPCKGFRSPIEVRGYRAPDP